MVKVYTKTGDEGTTSLYNGVRRSKTDVVFDALGTVDELSSMIGVARCFEERIFIPFLHDKHQDYQGQLEWIQDALLRIGSCIATPLNSSPENKLEQTAFPEVDVHLLENWIDEMDLKLPPLTTFILPVGTRFSSFIHVCRAICRRAERYCVALMKEDELDGVCVRFLNRLSDYFFTLARYDSM